MRKKRPLPILRNIEISGIAAEGKAIARYEEMVVFIPFAAPGDIADIQITKKRRNYMEGRVVKLHHRSGMRSEPFCEHFGICGGCKWQHLDYEYQLRFKQQQVLDHFSRIGKIGFPSPDPVLPSPKTTYYRNKLEFTFTDRRWLTEEEVAPGEPAAEFRAVGFHIPGRFDKVLDINKCYLQKEPSNTIRMTIRDYAISNNLDFFNLVKQEGFLRTLIIRTSTTGEVMVILVFFHEERSHREKLLTFLADSFPGITSLMYVINPKANDTITDLDVKLFTGRDHILEEMEGLKFKVGPKSFYQTNSLQARELYKIVLEYAAPQKHETIYDLYTGTGTIACFIARHCRRVCGFEYVPEAVDDAMFNAEINGLDNISFYPGDIRELLTVDFTGRHGVPDTIITDPPRTGMHQGVIERILDILPEKIVYVSCNSATQARDISLLDAEYRIERMRAADMFPHTHHIENVVLLVRR
ncbi:MAG: 23S rRNA (uracil(1939)-C(5))-methyltransferase RlmD [Bacteroidales bacterium]